jgi:predicted DNA-binding protein (MmcQ/YjbR family)
VTIDDIKSICKKLPAVTEDVKWGADLCFCVGTKMFCVTGLDQTPVSASFKVKDEEFEEVVARQNFRPAAYVARYKWVTVEDVTKISKKELERLIQQSYDLVRNKLPKKIKEDLGPHKSKHP